jgi:hypothetical protein
MLTDDFLERFNISLFGNPEGFLKHGKVVVNLNFSDLGLTIFIIIVVLTIFLFLGLLLWLKVYRINLDTHCSKERLSDVESSYVWVSHIYLESFQNGDSLLGNIRQFDRSLELECSQCTVFDLVLLLLDEIEAPLLQVVEPGFYRQIRIILIFPLGLIFLFLV